MEKLSDEKLKKLNEAFSIGCSLDEACVHADISRMEFLDHCEANKDYLESIERMKLKPKIKARMTAVKNLDKPEHAKWYLTKKCPDEFGDKIKHEVDGEIWLKMDDEDDILYKKSKSDV